MRTKNLTRLHEARATTPQDGSVLGGLLVLLVALLVALGLLLALVPAAHAEIPSTGPISTRITRCHQVHVVQIPGHTTRAARCRVVVLSSREG